MFRRAVNSIVALQPLCVALLCAILITTAVPVTHVFHVLLSAEVVEPLEGDEAPLEDPVDSGALPQRVRLREDLCCALNGKFAERVWISSSTFRGPRFLTLAGAAGEMIGRNGCGAVLRC